MAFVVVREFGKVAESHVGAPTMLSRGVLLSDENQTPIKAVVLPSPGQTIDVPNLSGKTHWVSIESEVNIRYCVRPKWDIGPVGSFKTIATQYHSPAPAGAAVMEAVHPGASISIYVV